jgi:hypothetical protein
MFIPPVILIFRDQKVPRRLLLTSWSHRISSGVRQNNGSYTHIHREQPVLFQRLLIYQINYQINLNQLNFLSQEAKPEVNYNFWLGRHSISAA